MSSCDFVLLLQEAEAKSSIFLSGGGGGKRKTSISSNENLNVTQQRRQSPLGSEMNSENGAKAGKNEDPVPKLPPKPGKDERRDHVRARFDEGKKRSRLTTNGIGSLAEFAC
jgi:hypothetical protein